MEKEIELGDTVKDMISGFKGVAVTKTEFLNGCIQYGIVAKIDKNNKMPEEFSIDEHQLKVVEKKKKLIEKDKTGGPIKKMSKIGRHKR